MTPNLHSWRKRPNCFFKVTTPLFGFPYLFIFFFNSSLFPSLVENYMATVLKEEAFEEENLKVVEMEKVVKGEKAEEGEEVKAVEEVRAKLEEHKVVADGERAKAKEEAGENVEVDIEPKTGVSLPVKLGDGKQLNSVGCRKKKILGLGVNICDVQPGPAHVAIGLKSARLADFSSDFSKKSGCRGPEQGNPSEPLPDPLPRARGGCRPVRGPLGRCGAAGAPLGAVAPANGRAHPSFKPPLKTLSAELLPHFFLLPKPRPTPSPFLFSLTSGSCRTLPWDPFRGEPLKSHP